MKKYILFCIAVILYAEEFEVAVAKKVLFGQKVEAVAKIIESPQSTQVIKAPIDGHIQKVFVQPGATVQKGTKLLQLRSGPLSELIEAKKRLDQQKRILARRIERAKKLLGQGLLSKNEYEDLLLQLKKTQEQQRAIEAKLQSLGGIVKNGTLILVAHENGTIESIEAKVHAEVARGEALVRFGSSKKLFKTYLPVQYAQKEPIGAKFCIEKCYEVAYSKTLPFVDEESGLAQMVFEGQGEGLLGAFGKMELLFKPTRQLFVLPKSAVTKFEGEWVVFVQDEDGDFIPKVVDIVTFFGDEVALEGLKEGDRYVVSGVYYVKSHLLKSSLGEHGH